jgi:hypothetical protein
MYLPCLVSRQFSSLILLTWRLASDTTRQREKDEFKKSRNEKHLVLWSLAITR